MSNTLPDITNGLNKHQAENLLVQRDDALTRIDLLTVDFEKYKKETSKEKEMLLSVIKEQKEDIGKFLKTLKNVVEERNLFAEACGGTEAGQKLLMTRKLAELQRQTAEVEAKLSILS